MPSDVHPGGWSADASATARGRREAGRAASLRRCQYRRLAGGHARLALNR